MPGIRDLVSFLMPGILSVAVDWGACDTCQGHSAGGAALGLSCAACFERLAGVFASAGASIWFPLLSHVSFWSPILTRDCLKRGL